MSNSSLAINVYLPGLSEKVKKAKENIKLQLQIAKKEFEEELENLYKSIVIRYNQAWRFYGLQIRRTTIEDVRKDPNKYCSSEKFLIRYIYSNQKDKLEKGLHLLNELELIIEFSPTEYMYLNVSQLQPLLEDYV
jgi:hypothetical protein